MNLNITTKNNAGSNYEKISLSDYAELFVNFKLKVAEAYNLKMDTAKTSDACCLVIETT